MCILSYKVKRAGGIWQLSSLSRSYFLGAITALTKWRKFRERGGVVDYRGIL
jgi:hypothetical protein